MSPEEIEEFENDSQAVVELLASPEIHWQIIIVNMNIGAKLCGTPIFRHTKISYRWLHLRWLFRIDLLLGIVMTNLPVFRLQIHE